ncbi:O-methylsterigmatocystin oxidoreductase OS=Aspergillus flavus GN=ordA PE=3 SV=2 [Rhizoctonia solani AG-1 IB]|nr:O-methylsterigmatocystin oxidoreductase OS=Aspergillus flavus GN=ordA PE=3 SV=2 [Rhizoctonia solani AG-1 IB]
MFWPIIEQGARFTARRFLDNPSSGDIFSEMYRMTGSNILSAVYGYSTTSAEDPILKLVQVGLSGFIKAAVPTNFLVNYFPFLEVIPSWFPGAGWKRLAETWRQDKENMINVPYEWAKQHMASGTAPPSIVNTLLTNLRSKSSESPELAAQMEEQEDPLKWAVGSLFGAGSETSASSILVALLAMINYPDVQAKAKQELDNLLGGERLPVLRDRDSLPYMRNIVKEALRWRSVLPGGK